jgi:hypothetical protein
VSFEKTVYRAATLTALACSLSALGGGAAAARTSSATCGRDQYDLRIFPAWKVRGGVVAGITTANTPPCLLDTTVRVTVRYRDHSVARVIRGNPAKWQIRKQLGPWQMVEARAFTWQNWCHPKPPSVVTVSAAGREEAVRVRTPAQCRNRRAASKLVNSSVPRLGGIPAGILSPDAPIPLSPALIRTTNAWLVSDGRTLVAVYAGEAGNDPAIGRFAIVRQNLLFGLQTCQVIDLGRIGAVRITRAPAGAAAETSAQQGELEYSSATGAQGVLSLAAYTPDSPRC